MMMGFRVFNGDGEMVTDSSYLGYGLVMSGNANLVSQQPMDISFPSPIRSDSPPIICIKAKVYNNSWIRFCRPVGVPTNWTGFRIVSARQINTVPHYGLCEYRVYANGVSSSDSFGLRIANESGEIIIDSGVPQMEFKTLVTLFDWPIVWDSLLAQGNAFAYHKAVANNNVVMSLDEWIPVSLANYSYTTTQSSNWTGKFQTYVMDVEVSWCYYQGKISAVIEMVSQVPPQNYTLKLSTFCPIILN